MNIEPRTWKFLIYSVVFYVAWLFIMRSCVSGQEEYVNKYMEFHRGTFYELCNNSYDKLTIDAQQSCNVYFQNLTNELGE